MCDELSKMKISVVIPVFNEADRIAASVNSVIAQPSELLEVIIVNDGSDGEATNILEELAQQHDLIRLIHQENAGITQALINGCNVARGEYIARQDIGDISEPTRFARQITAMDSNPTAVLCSSGSRFLSAESEELFTVNDNSKTANQGLHPNTLEELRGPSHHGVSFFRKDAYEKVGGYRAQFKVAQDMDLWLRLAQIGEHITTSSLEYQAVLRPTAISTVKRHQQEAVRKWIFKCHQARLQDQDDQDILEQFAQWLSSNPVPTIKHKQAEADYAYFVGSLLHQRKDAAAKAYFQRAVRLSPANVKAWLKLLRAYFFKTA